MKKIKNSILFTVVFGLLFSSCDEWLTLEPEDGSIRDNYWKTKEEVYASVIGLYSGMLSSDFLRKMYLWGELRGETMSNNGSRVNSDYQAIRDGEITATNSMTDWASFYQVINLCNTVYEFAPKAQKTDPSFTDALLKQYQAEAVAIRSLLYFYLVRTFRDVPYYTEALFEDDQRLQFPKTEGSAILDSLTVDLERIAPYIADNYGQLAAPNKGRFTRYGVYTLLADIYLWKEDYSNCVVNCNRVLNSGKYALLLGNDKHRYEVEFLNPVTNEVDTVYAVHEDMVNTMFDQLYVTGNSDESIFELQIEQDCPNTAYWSLFSNSSGFFKANLEVLNDIYFLPSELNNNCYDIRGDGISRKSDVIWKPMGRAREGTMLELVRPSQDDMLGNVIVYRLGELYLMKAEALALQASTADSAQRIQCVTEALDLIYALRNRANATETTDLCYETAPEDVSVSTLIQFVYEERIREMMFEGKRWFDALRFAKRGDYAENNLNYLTQMASYGATVTKVGTLHNKLKNKDFHYLPINDNEIKASNNILVQNPFYN